MGLNHLYYGDNLDILRRYIKDESVDLVYLDPPFQSNAGYNVLFAEHDGTGATAQIKAFEDTWRWDTVASRSYAETVERGGDVSRTLQAFRTILSESDMLAYLAMMAPRLVELHRVLKDTGSIYLHCDSTASHYLRVLLDAIFGPRNARNEIIWKRSSAHSDGRQGARHYGRITDSILFYAKSENNTWNQQYVPYDQSYIDRDYRRLDENGRRYRLDNIQGPGGAAKGNPYYEVMGVWRHWRYSKEKMEDLIQQGRIIQTRPGAVPQYKRYLDEMPGVPVQNLWDNVPAINNRSAELLGYPTQKPRALLERMIMTSSDPGDVILDPFCGCGTAIDAAQRLDRQWIGIDVTAVAITVIKNRLASAYSGRLDGTYETRGEPTTAEDAAVLAASDQFQFQAWALGLVNARPTDVKKGADRGIDGRLYFHEKSNEPTRQIIFSVKAGKVDVSQARDLRGVIEREMAAIGVLISLQEPTRPMRIEAASAGHYMTGWDDLYPRIQLLTVSDLITRTSRVEYPDWARDLTYKPAPRVEDKPTVVQHELMEVAQPSPPTDPLFPLQPSYFEMPPKEPDKSRRRSPRPPLR